MGPGTFEQTFSGPAGRVAEAVTALSRVNFDAREIASPYTEDATECGYGWVVASTTVLGNDGAGWQAAYLSTADDALSVLGFVRRIHGLAWPMGGGS